MAEVTRLARLAKGELPIRQIAIVTGVTRQTVYTMLDDGEP
ncbi:MAG: helix-turn-helix domain-containing protein [Actinomycetota bacterium]|nr:helix-turn-helix domain-containing protein [Actinomycetota bacterium]